MEFSSRTIFVCVMALETYACGIYLPKEFVAQGFDGQNEENSKLEDVMDLSKPALHTLLKGLAALLVQLYPDITPKPPSSSSSSKEKRDEPIKIFRQIMQIPGQMFPPVPPMYPCHQMCGQDQMQHQHPTQMPQDPPQNFHIHPIDPSQQMHPHAPLIAPRPPQEPRPQQCSPLHTTQITEQCFPTSPCCQQNIDPQQNPFFPEQYNTC